MACGRPVIGAAVGGITVPVADGEAGCLVPPRDPEALAGRMRHLLARPDLRARMGRAARARVEREFTWATTAGRVAALYEEAMASPAAGDRRSAGDVQPATADAPMGVLPQAAGAAPLADAAAYAEAD